jgi:hypothetical protein
LAGLAEETAGLRDGGHGGALAGQALQLRVRSRHLQTIILTLRVLLSLIPVFSCVRYKKKLSEKLGTKQMEEKSQEKRQENNTNKWTGKAHIDSMNTV